VIVLGIDTATADTVVALRDDATGAMHEARVGPGARRPRHSPSLLATVVEEMAAFGARWSDIDRIAVGVGPGTFTGLRIGIATALGLARAREIPVVGVSTLRSLASAPAAATAAAGPTGVPETPDAVVAAIDARRGEVFAGAWSITQAEDPDSEPWLAPAAMAPEALADALRDCGRVCLTVGDGAVAFRACLEPAGALIPPDGSQHHHVSAIEHCRWACRLPAQDPAGVRPDYLRLPDAEISLRAAGVR
jgi:tRNA threonylcarbamoyladenosine biosynthesis protein TsaB